MMVTDQEVSVVDLTLAVKTWGEPESPAIVALHGWQDNAATFDMLAPCFPDHYWVIPDLPGHGRSEHRGKGADYAIWQYAVEVMALVDAMALEQFTLVGHSMGGGIASMLAGLFPDRISRLVLLDVIGTITTPASASATQLRQGILKRIGNPLRKAGRYPTRDAAIIARANNGITREAAALLGERGIRQGESYYYWGHDQRLSLRSLQSLDDEQINSYLQAIACPVLLVTSQEAVQTEAVIRDRAALVRDIQVMKLAGGHHQHLDGDVDAIAALIRTFL